MKKHRVPTVRKKSGKIEKNSRSGNFELSQGNLKFWEKSGNFITINLSYMFFFNVDNYCSIK